MKFELLVLLQTNNEISSGIKIGINHEKEREDFVMGN